MSNTTPDQMLTNAVALIINELELDADNALDRLAALTALRQTLATHESTNVDGALTQGATWQQIGSALGVSKQAAHERFSPRRSR